jgi:NitT/TauT family transport system substrate-binding protein
MTITYPYITNAQQFRFFEQEGVNIELVMGQGSPQILSLLVAGAVDLVFCNPEPIIKLDVQRAQNIKSIIAVQHGQYVLAAPEDSSIRDVSDLKGKRLGMFSPESGIDYLKARLLDAGMTVADIQIVPTSFGGQTIAAVRGKQVDAILYWVDAMELMRQAGLALRDLPKAPWEPGLVQYIGATTQTVIDTKTDALTRAVRAMTQGMMMSAIAPQLTVEAFWRQYPDQMPKPENREKAMEQTLGRILRYNPALDLPANPTKADYMSKQWGEQTLKAWTRMQENLVRTGAIASAVDPASLFDDRFIAPGNRFDRDKLFEIAARGK